MTEEDLRNWLIDWAKFWVGQAFVSLLAAYIATQQFRHGTLAVRPTGGDVVPTLIAFAIIFAAVVGVTHLAARLGEEGELEKVADDEEI